MKRDFANVRTRFDEMAKEVDDILSDLQALGQRRFRRKGADAHWKRASNTFLNKLLDAVERFYDCRNRLMEDAMLIAGRVMEEKWRQQVQRFNPDSPQNSALSATLRDNQKLRDEMARLRNQPAPKQKPQLPPGTHEFTVKHLAKILGRTERNICKHAEKMEDAEKGKTSPCTFYRKCGTPGSGHRLFRSKIVANKNEISVEDFLDYMWLNHRG